jgi:putative lipoic acid-binding regulatory protein
MQDERSSTLGKGGGAGSGARPEVQSGTGKDGVEGIVYPVEFELRVIYLLEAGSTLPADLHKVLAASRASPGAVRELAAPAGKTVPGGKYGRLACPVRFEDKESMYAAYAAVGALPGVKAVL